MENQHHHPRYDSSGPGRENKPHRKKGFAAGAGGSAPGAHGGEEGEKKPKFVSSSTRFSPASASASCPQLTWHVLQGLTGPCPPGVLLSHISAEGSPLTH
ncbi:hypothetical protein AOLI_G00151790 [Acnodon oligacanthus]